MPADQTLTENSRRVLLVLRKTSREFPALWPLNLPQALHSSYALAAKARLKDPQQLAETLNPLIERGLVSGPTAAFTERAILGAAYHIPPGMAGTVDSLLKQQPLKLGL